MKFLTFLLPIFVSMSAIAVFFGGCVDENKEHEKQLDKIKAYISDKGLTNVVTTESGLSYKITQEGTGSNPVATSNASCYYKGYLLDGSVFDEHSRSGGSAAKEFNLSGVIAGWTEGIPKMKAGGKALFLIPSRLGYKAQATGSIPANSVLVFEVELVSFRN
jgi:FKBP-type peptidyl-prolyl cis-trans isomerase FkpA